MKNLVMHWLKNCQDVSFSKLTSAVNKMSSNSSNSQLKNSVKSVLSSIVPVSFQLESLYHQKVLFLLNKCWKYSKLMLLELSTCPNMLLELWHHNKKLTDKEELSLTSQVLLDLKDKKDKLFMLPVKAQF